MAKSIRNQLVDTLTEQLKKVRFSGNTNYGIVVNRLFASLTVLQ